MNARLVILSPPRTCLFHILAAFYSLVQDSTSEKQVWQIALLTPRCELRCNGRQTTIGQAYST
jgi:hypothetical protein